MFPRQHIFFSAILCLILYPFIGLNAIVVFLSAVLIDFDHYLYYVIKFKKFGIKKAYLWHIKHKYPKLCVFHLIEFVFIVLILSLLFNYYYVFIGMIFHLILDFIYERISKKTRIWSLINTIFK